MVHLLVSADSLDLEGLISSPFGLGRVEHIHEVIDRYERDFANLRTCSARYPTPDYLDGSGTNTLRFARAAAAPRMLDFTTGTIVASEAITRSEQASERLPG